MNSIEQVIVGEAKIMNNTISKKKLVRDISANTIQTGITQLFGLIIFYLTSKCLTKDDFGDLNWSTAVGSTIIAISSLGLDLVFVKRVAQGKDTHVLSAVHFFHNLATGLFLCIVIFGMRFFLTEFTINHPLFFLIFLNLALANVANSFKLCLNGLESYKKLAVLAFCTNLTRFLLILSLYIASSFTIYNVVYTYLLTSFFEFILAKVFINRELGMKLKPLIKIKEYKTLILESLPQLGIVLFDSALARIDWILLGILSTAAITAEYSFVYKVFELSKLPILIIAPLMLTRFSKLFKTGEITPVQKENILIFFKLELLVIMFIPILLITTWTPLVDYFTNNKYGAVNELNYLLLAFCVPLSALINFLWTLGFVQGQLKTIMYITILVSILNILCNLFLIPLFGALGASIAFLICTGVQVLLYLKYIKQDQIKLQLFSFLKILIMAAVAIIVAKFLINNIIFTPVIALIIYLTLFLYIEQIQIKQIKQILKN